MKFNPIAIIISLVVVILGVYLYNIFLNPKAKPQIPGGTTPIVPSLV